MRRQPERERGSGGGNKRESGGSLGHLSRATRHATLRALNRQEQAGVEERVRQGTPMPLTDAMLTFHYDNAMERVLRIMTMERELGGGCSTPDRNFNWGWLQVSTTNSPTTNLLVVMYKFFFFFFFFARQLYFKYCILNCNAK